MPDTAERPALGFAGLLRQLRAEARLTQEQLAEAASLSPRSVSDLERGVSRTARKDTAELLADALGLAEPVRGLFVAAALGRGEAEDVLAARDGRTPGTGHRVVRWARGCPYRGLLPFGESDAEVFYGRERLAAELAAKLAARAASGGLVVITGASGSGKSSLLRAGLVPILARGQQVPGSDRWARIVMTPPGWPPSAARTLWRSATGWPGTRTRRSWPSGRRCWPPRPAAMRSCQYLVMAPRGWCSSWTSSSRCSP
jgi:transcriptional regulator with XRE-family HTH domain